MGGVGTKFQTFLCYYMVDFKIRKFQSHERCPQAENAGNTRCTDGGMELILHIFETDSQMVTNFPEFIALFTTVSHFTLESVKFRLYFVYYLFNIHFNIIPPTTQVSKLVCLLQMLWIASVNFSIFHSNSWSYFLYTPVCCLTIVPCYLFIIRFYVKTSEFVFSYKFSF